MQEKINVEYKFEIRYVSFLYITWMKKNKKIKKYNKIKYNKYMYENKFLYLFGFFKV